MTLHCLWMYINDIAMDVYRLSMDVYMDVYNK